MRKLSSLSLFILIVLTVVTGGSIGEPYLTAIPVSSADISPGKAEASGGSSYIRTGGLAEPPLICEGCNQTAADPPKEDPSPITPVVRTRWDLWTNGTLLRGVNIWQKALYPKDKLNRDGKLEVFFETKYTSADFAKMRSWGANYVNISYPGIYSQKPVETARRKPKTYIPVEDVISNLKQLIVMSRNAGLFVVVSIRTGPGRNEAVFDENESDPITTVWKTDEGGVLTPKACEAQNAWVEMWGRVARELKDFPNVVGYELMVEPHQEREQKKNINKQELWFTLAERLTEAIRREDTRTPVLIGGANVSTACSLSCIDPDRFNKYGRIIYVAHQYEPYDLYTHQANRYAGFRCEGGQPVNKKPDSDKPHAPYNFNDSVKAVMYERYKFMYGFRNSHGMIPVAINEFGVVRYAGTEEKRDAYEAIEFEMSLNERIGANHALWLWETTDCIEYDDMNIKRGPDPLKHVDLVGAQELADNLINVIKKNWARNKIYATPELLNILAAETFPSLSLPSRPVSFCEKPAP